MPQETSIHRVFGHIHDPRASNVSYPLIHLIFMTLVAMVCGAQDWADVVEICRGKKAFLSEYLDFRGVPSPDTFERVFSLLDPDAFNAAMTQWVSELAGSLQGKHLSADGKTMRASFTNSTQDDFFHTTSLFLTEANLFLASTGSRGAGHEVQDLRKLLERVDVTGATITMDALHTSTVTAQLLQAQGAGYIMALKDNCSARLQEVQDYFEVLEQDDPQTGYQFSQTNKGHGRVEERSTWAVALTGEWFGNQEQWHGLQTLIRVERSRWEQTTETEERKVRYFLSSEPAEQVEQLAQGIRGHWSIENQGHWCLDVILDEDRSRARRENAAANMSTLKRFSLNLLRAVKYGPGAIKRRRFKAMMKDRYLRSILTSL